MTHLYHFRLKRHDSSLDSTTPPRKDYGGFGGAPPANFLKSMSLRLHFKPFRSPFSTHSITSILSKVRNSNPEGGGGGGGTLIFSYIRRLGLFWGVQNFEFRYFWGFSGK